MASDEKRVKKTYSEMVDNVDAMHEIFKHLDAQTLAVASCVSKPWHQAALDDELWEMICTQHWPATTISDGRLRSVVNVLGGFRRLYFKWLHPLRKHAVCKKSEDSLFMWSEDQVQLSLSLFSVEYYERLGSFRTGSSSCYGSPCTLSNPALLQKVQSALCRLS